MIGWERDEEAGRGRSWKGGGRGTCFYMSIFNLVHMVTGLSASVHCRIDGSDGCVTTEFFILSTLVSGAPLCPLHARLHLCFPQIMRATDKGVILLPLCIEGGMYVMDNRWIYIFFLHHVFHIVVKFPLSRISLIRCNRESRRSINVFAATRDVTSMTPPGVARRMAAQVEFNHIIKVSNKRL